MSRLRPGLHVLGAPRDAELTAALGPERYRELSRVPLDLLRRRAARPRHRVARTARAVRDRASRSIVLVTTPEWVTSSVVLDALVTSPAWSRDRDDQPLAPRQRHVGRGYASAPSACRVTVTNARTTSSSPRDPWTADPMPSTRLSGHRLAASSDSVSQYRATRVTWTIEGVCVSSTASEGSLRARPSLASAGSAPITADQDCSRSRPLAFEARRVRSSRSSFSTPTIELDRDSSAALDNQTSPRFVSAISRLLLAARLEVAELLVGTRPIRRSKRWRIHAELALAQVGDEASAGSRTRRRFGDRGRVATGDTVGQARAVSAALLLAARRRRRERREPPGDGRRRAP